MEQANQTQGQLTLLVEGLKQEKAMLEKQLYILHQELRTVLGDLSLVRKQYKEYQMNLIFERRNQAKEFYRKEYGKNNSCKHMTEEVGDSVTFPEGEDVID